MARLAWGITGAGHFLKKTFEVMEKITKNHDISCYVSSAGEKVVGMYNLSNKMTKISPGGYYKELVLETVDGAASPLIGRFLRGAYDALIVAPASANTVAKMVHGISDTLVTNAAAQSEKGGVPIIILPTDQKPGKTKTKSPYRIDRVICQRCESCQVIGLCPHGAIILSSGLPTIDLSKCTSCGICLERCPHGAVSFGKEITIRTRKIDVENVVELRKNPSFILISEPVEIPSTLRGVLGGKKR